MSRLTILEHTSFYLESLNNFSYCIICSPHSRFIAEVSPMAKAFWPTRWWINPPSSFLIGSKEFRSWLMLSGAPTFCFIRRFLSWSLFLFSIYTILYFSLLTFLLSNVFTSQLQAIMIKSAFLKQSSIIRLLFPKTSFLFFIPLTNKSQIPN